MTTITAIRAVRGGETVDVMLTGGEHVRLSSRRLLEAELAAGRRLGDEALEQLRRWARLDAAEQQALRLLARRPRSRAQIAERCTREGLDANEVEAIVDRLAAAGLVNDAALAERVADQRRTAGHGCLRIERDLHRMGIDQPVVRGHADELDRARQELQKRFGALPLDDPRMIARAAAHLGRRGFEGDVVAEALGLDSDR